MASLFSRILSYDRRLKRDRAFCVRATPMRLSSGKGWTVFFETRHSFGAVGWNLSEADARILAAKIETGERDV